MKSVIEQLPRLLAAMERISIEVESSEGSFDLFCMFSVVRQVINSKCMAGINAISQLPMPSSGRSKEKKQSGSGTLRELVVNARNGTSSNIPGCIKRISLFSADNISLKFKKEKGKNGNSSGVITFDLTIEPGIEGQRDRSGNNNSFGFTVAIGTHKNSVLLSQKNIMMSITQRQKFVRREVTMQFDWNLANSFGGVESGHIILRILSTDRRGMDVQYKVKLV